MEIDSWVQLSQTGVAGIALFVSFQLWNMVKVKDEHNEKLEEKLLLAFTEQSRINAGLKESIDNNTKATENLTSSLFAYVINQKRRKGEMVGSIQD